MTAPPTTTAAAAALLPGDVVARTIKTVAWLLRDEAAWTQGRFGVDADGNTLDGPREMQAAASCCLLGAIERAAPGDVDKQTAVTAALLHTLRATGSRSRTLAGFNDSARHADVLGLLSSARQAAKASTWPIEPAWVRTAHRSSPAQATSVQVRDEWEAIGEWLDTDRAESGADSATPSMLEAARDRASALQRLLEPAATTTNREGRDT